MPSKGWILLFLYTLFLFKGAVLSAEEVPRFFAGLNDKFVHAVEYFLLFLFAFNAFRSFLPAVIYCTVIGALTEMAQLWVPSRSCDFKDWLADVCGALAAAFLFTLIPKLRGAS